MNYYNLKCRDLGFENCEFVATGNSESEIKRKVFFHTVLNHEEELKAMADEEKMKIHEIIKNIIDNQN